MAEKRKRGRPWPYSLRQWIKDASRSETDECLPWPFKLDMKGYPYAKHKNRAYRPTRLMCRISNGSVPAELNHAAHLCGNRACMNPRHLVWATPKENESHKRLHGTVGSRISDATVAEIIRQFATGNYTLSELGRRYGVSHMTIGRFVRGERRGYIYKECAGAAEPARANGK